MRTRRLSAPTAALAVLVLSGCGVIGDSDDECQDVDQAVVDEIMSHARSDVTTSKGLEIARVEFRDAASVPMPADQQRFGVERLMSLTAMIIYGGESTDDKIGGTEGVFFFALDGDGTVMAAVDTQTQDVFDLPPPEESEWDTWGEGVKQSQVAVEAFGCINPNR